MKLSIDNLHDVFQERAKQISSAEAMLKKATDIESMKKVLEVLQNIRIELAENLNEAYDVTDEMEIIKLDMNDCGIAANMTERKNELDGLV